MKVPLNGTLWEILYNSNLQWSHISDGDTVHLLTDKKEKIKIRLNDIDAPENKQAYGNKSKENLKKYIYQKNVVVEYKNKDKYKRVLGTIYY